MAYEKVFDFLSIVHLINFYLIGLVVKKSYVFAFCLGVLWELLEYIITSTSYTRNLLIKYWPVPMEIWDERLINVNRFSDLVFNMIGYHLAQ
tara:strand:- start:235 stop:510 length:276 start_codon:yes stop_codon:yes gene_type:complete